MLRKTVKILLPVLLAAVFFSSMFTLKVGAESQSDGGSYIRDFISDLLDFDDDNDPVETAPVYTEPEPEPPTENTTPSFTDPEPTRPTETVPVPTETVPPETEAPYYPEEETESPRDEYAQLLEEAEEPTGMNSVKMDKSVSNKAYTTDNMAGIVSWICVGVGLIVVAVMLITTKITGRRSSQREI